MTSLSRNARVAGMLYIASSVPGFFRLIYIPSALFVAGNAAATASNIASHEFLFRTGIVAYLLCNVLWIFVTLALYRLLKSVDQTLAWLLIVLGLVFVPAALVNAVNDVAALMFIRGDFLSVFDQAQRDALATLFLNLHHQVDLAQDFVGGLWFIPRSVCSSTGRASCRASWAFGSSSPVSATSRSAYLAIWSLTTRMRSPRLPSSS